MHIMDFHLSWMGLEHNLHDRRGITVLKKNGKFQSYQLTFMSLLLIFPSIGYLKRLRKFVFI